MLNPLYGRKENLSVNERGFEKESTFIPAAEIS